MGAAVWLVAVFLSGVLSLLAAAAVTQYSRSLRQDPSWPERARARWTGVPALWFAALFALGLATALGADRLIDRVPLHPVLAGLASAIAALLGVLTAVRILGSRDPRPTPSWRARLGGALAWVVLFTVLPPLVVTFVVAPWEWGPRVGVALGAGALTWLWMGLGGGTRLLLLLGVATPAPGASCSWTPCPPTRGSFPFPATWWCSARSSRRCPKTRRTRSSPTRRAI